MTAIAAVIALSSTPLFAQGVDAPVAEAPAPVVETTPAPVVADEPLAPAPAAEAAAAADPLAPVATAKPAARKATTAKPTAARARPAPARAASAAPAVTAAPAAVTMAPVVNGPPIEPLPIEPEVAPVVAPVAEPAAPAETASLDSMIVPAGIGGLGILALTGAGLAVRRRRRRAAEAEDAAWQEQAESLPDAVAEPAMIVEPKPGYMPEQTEPAFVQAFVPVPTATPVAAVEPDPSAPVDGPVTELHDGFDLSRFGPHMQAAYNGPTVDNPSLSLKNRLRRASAMDQLERKAEDESVTAEAPAVRPSVAQHDKADFMLARSGKKPSLRPAYTH